ncbi:cellulase family glycosylhydrolase [Gordonia sp. ABSL1-1]|uniref:cellulase family glycosylhydrolase n=1 Tax=Gordonia sp. ABSL1-1 TaxID=3053923 RepID=UPI002572E99B|nr:cellulase family glycosylhydrolase [Gordonia sp. ABSL1-1]MDL9935776.1 cellulase family glycosylhydrolase [Gordonia sp. ABSL1-1]
MPIRARLAVALTSVLLLAATATLIQTSRTAATPHRSDTPATSAVTTDGRWLIDDQGRTIYVHGLQIANKKPPYHAPPAAVTDRDAALIKSLGVNSVRLAWFWKGLEPVRGRIDQAYLNEIVREVDVLTRNGLWVLLEFHQDNYNEKVHGAGFPDWATFTDGAPNPPEAIQGSSAFLNPALQRAFDNLYANRAGIQDSMASAWKTLAHSVISNGADHGRLLGYDLFNEPWPGSAYPSCAAGCPAFDRGRLQPLQDRLARAVRTVDRRTPVFYEPHLLADIGVPSYLEPVPAGVAPVVYSFHDYCGTSLVTKKADRESTSLGYPACPALDETVYRNAIDTATRMRAGLMQTEFGDTQDLTELERIMQLADKYLTGWMLWGYKDWIDYPGGIGDGDLFDNPDDLSTLRRPMANVIARATPQAIAGVPTRYRYDPTTGRMELSWTARPGVSAPTDIFVPVARHYPAGYRVTVTGGTVVSAPNAEHLLVTNTAPSVRVVLTRAS